MLAVIKENGLHEASYMEFLPRIMQRLVFFLYESYGGFSVKFTKYYSLVHVYVVHKHNRPRRIPFMAWLGCLWTNFLMCSYSWTGQGGFFFAVDDNARMNYTWHSSSLVAPLSLCCLLVRFFFFFFWSSMLDCWHVAQSKVFQSCHFVFWEKCHVASPSWSRHFPYQASLPINSEIPLLPFHISKIFSSDICCLAPRLEVFPRL